MKKKVIFGIALLALTACTSKQDEIDINAASMLQTSRQLLSQSKYDAARDTLLSMRKKYPTAIEARKQGILLLDSIEMTAAADSMTSASDEDLERLQMKTMFFQRKLQEDMKKRRVQ